MAFDLVQYFAEQIKIQKPQLLRDFTPEQQHQYVSDINALTLGKLISLWRNDENALYQEIRSQDQLYIQEIARRLTTTPKNQSSLDKIQLEHLISEVLTLQLAEIKQLDDTAHFGPAGLAELLLGQIEHLAGQADDWVWSTNELTELIGSKPITQETVSLDETMKEFHQMVQQADTHHEEVNSTENSPLIPAWSNILAPVVALAIIAYLYCQMSQLFN